MMSVSKEADVAFNIWCIYGSTNIILPSCNMNEKLYSKVLSLPWAGFLQGWKIVNPSGTTVLMILLGPECTNSLCSIPWGVWLSVFKCSPDLLQCCNLGSHCCEKSCGRKPWDPSLGAFIGTGIKLRSRFLGFACAQPSNSLSLSGWLGS